MPTRVWSPVVTPFDGELAPDSQRLIRHCRWLLDHDVGLAVFGTNSEANSLSVADKQRLLAALGEAGIPGERLMPGTGACAIEDCVVLTRSALGVGSAGVLMLPPFYYKGVSDDGLFRYYAEVIERVGDAKLRIYLYHIPPVAQVPLSLDLVGRLIEAYPETVVGVKDSGGDWEHTRSLIEHFSAENFHVYAGSERFLLPTLRAGGAGCISATANVNPGPIARLAATWQEEDADERQRGLDRVRDLFEGFPMIPALKAALAGHARDGEWARVRPPLMALDDDRQHRLLGQLEDAGFEMPGL